MENIRRDARMRVETDGEMGAAWIAVPLLSLVSGIAFLTAYFLVVVPSLFSAFTFTNRTTTLPRQPPSPEVLAAIRTLFLLLGVFIIFLVVLALVAVYMFYRLVKRRNTHFYRQLFLYDGLVNLGREVGAKKSVDVSLQLNNLQRTLTEARFEETEKSAILWAILGFLTGGLTNLYVYYFLMKDFYRHERREDIFIDDVTRLFASAGTPLNLPRRINPVPDRSFILYLVINIITGGLFGIYWLYVLLTDPNNHFRHQAITEDTLIAQATPVLA